MTHTGKGASDTRQASVIAAENIRMLMARYNDTRRELAAFMGIGVRTLDERFAAPWEFRLDEIESAAMRYDATVPQLFRPMRFADDDE